MLKKLIVNQKTVPVPVPVRNLAEACHWIDEVLVPIGETVTSATLDGKDILDLWDATKTCASIALLDASRIEIRIESPEDLALQSFDAMHSLAEAILRGLKSLAVHLWQARKNDIQPELEAVKEDIGLIRELMDRIEEMGVEDKIDLRLIRELRGRVHNINLAIDAACGVGDWKAAAQILLRDTPTAVGLETSLRQLLVESEACHLRLFSIRHNKTTGSLVESK